MSFLKVGHIGADKVKFKFNITIHDLTLFEPGFKEAKIDPKNEKLSDGDVKKLQVLQDKIERLLKGEMVGEPRKKHETRFRPEDK